MYLLEIVTLVLFIVFTAIGYKKNNRNFLLLGSCCLLVGATAKPLSEGFIDGYEKTRTEINNE